MQIEKIKNNNVLVIDRAVNILRKGGVIIYPTDTAYALGCDADNKRACARIFKIKKRDKNKPLPLIAASAAMVGRFCQIDPIATKLMKKYWPGALSLLLSFHQSEDSPRGTRGLSSGVVIRVPDCQIARQLSQKLGRPIVSTSANLSGQPPCYSVEEVLKQLGEEAKKIDLILDGGALPKKKSSTIVKVVNDKVEVLRQGGVIIKNFAF